MFYRSMLEIEYKACALINAVWIISFSVSKDPMGLKVNEPGWLKFTRYSWKKFWRIRHFGSKKPNPGALETSASGCAVCYEGAITRHLLKLGWKPLRDRRDASTLCLFNLGLNHLANIPRSNLSQGSSHSRYMHNKHFHVPFARTNIFKLSFLPRAIRLWNRWPSFAVNSNLDIAAFEVLLKEI